MRIVKRFTIVAWLILIAAGTEALSQRDYTAFVNPFIGTGAKQNSLSASVFPGPCMPFGLVQLSPDEYTDPEEPASCYDYSKSTIFGFSHTHLNGTGVGDLYDILMMPGTGEIKVLPGNENAPGSGYGSTFSHTDEKAGCGYYRVLLKDYGITAELTATEHAGIHRYTFPASNSSHILIDLDHSVDKRRPRRSCRIISAQMKAIDNSTIEGYRIITGWSRLRKVYFTAKFSKPFYSHKFFFYNYDFGDIPVINGVNIKAALNFKTSDNEQIVVKVGISTVDMEGARKNLKAETEDKSFENLVIENKKAWNAELSKIDIEASDSQKQIIYTGLYRAFIQPNNLADVDGRFITPDYSTNVSQSGKYYSTFSLWDTYRAAHPLYTIIKPSKDAEFINTMLIQESYYGYLPIWHLWGDENYCMIGNHAIPIITDAILKGIPGFDYEKAYEACKTSSTVDHINSPWTVLNYFRYIPEDLQTQSVSITLELAYDDWCMAQLAKKMNKPDDYKFFSERAKSYRNLYDSASKFFRAKDKFGKWLEPFDPLQYGANGGFPFTEGNAWQYFWYVPQDVYDLSGLTGGKASFAAKLDTFFTLKDLPKEVNDNASGFIGQYAHGNEPSHHCVYLYNWTDEPWKTQYYSSKVQFELYDATTAGLCGNEDCGQMSAWYILSALGFYPVNPANGIYLLGSPSVQSAVLHLENGKDFTVKAKNCGKDNPYIQSVKLNGKKYAKRYIRHSDITSGAILEFEMGQKPNKNWGNDKEPIPDK